MLRPAFPTLQHPTMKRPISAENESGPKCGQALLVPGNQTRRIVEQRAVSNLAESRLCDKVAAKKNLELVLRVEPTTCQAQTLRGGPHLPTVCHSYSHSTSSGQQLLTANDAEEYLV